jgi:NADH-quinone oxidoreductase subunit D
MTEPASPATGDLTTKALQLNFGPQHPAMHGTLRLVLELDGERIVRATPEIGYLHSGFEKLGEYRGYNQFVTISDRMNYLSPLSNNIGYVHAVEALLGLEIPRRARVVRVILAELSRLADHVICLGLQGMDVGAFSVMLWTFVHREMLYDLFEIATGGRLTTSMTRVGGLARDVPPDFADRVRAVTARFPTILDELEKMLVENPIFTGRTEGIGRIAREEAIAYGFSGPCLRASGVRYDLRRDRPYLDYPEYAFEVPMLPDGDSLARFRIRWMEIRESLRIIEQALRRLEPGPVNALNHKITLPDKPQVYGTMEGMIHHFKQIMHGHGFAPPPGEVYAATEAPNGELGFYVISDGTRNPYRVRCRPPSFYNYQVISRILVGCLISDIVAILSSLNIIAGELDR